MRHRRLRRSTGRRRIPEWRTATGASNGQYQFATDSLVSHWAVWPVGTFDDSLESASVVYIPNNTDLTLVRSINQFAAWVTGPDASVGTPDNTDCMFTLGMGLIKFAHPTPSEINGLGFISNDQVPGPISTPNMDWVWRGLFSNRSFGSVSQQLGLGEQDFASKTSRAMRKLSQNEGLLQVLEFKLWNTDPLTNNFRDVSWFFESRCLLKEA